MGVPGEIQHPVEKKQHQAPLFGLARLVLPSESAKHLVWFQGK